jgi:hypothetical protein
MKAIMRKDNQTIFSNKITVLLIFMSLSTGNLLGQSTKGNLLENVITQFFLTYTPSDSAAYIDIKDLFDTLSRPTAVSGKKIIYLDFRNYDRVFSKNKSLKVIQISKIKATDDYLIVSTALFNGSYKKNKYTLNNADFYLNIYFKYDCTLAKFVPYSQTKTSH